MMRWAEPGSCISEPLSWGISTVGKHHLSHTHSVGKLPPCKEFSCLIPTNLTAAESSFSLPFCKSVFHSPVWLPRPAAKCCHFLLCSSDPIVSRSFSARLTFLCRHVRKPYGNCLSYLKTALVTHARLGEFHLRARIRAIRLRWSHFPPHGRVQGKSRTDRRKMAFKRQPYRSPAGG